MSTCQLWEAPKIINIMKQTIPSSEATVTVAKCCHEFVIIASNAPPNQNTANT
eukprot:COSAG01_NODE_53315_length_340_cov_0.643154_1_plen_52_part_01